MSHFKAFEVAEVSEKQFQGSVIERSVEQLPKGEVLISVHYSSLNYKDALSASGNRGVTREYPHTPGIDAAGTVLSSDSDKFQVGQEVLVTGYDLGMNTAGGFGQMIRVPANWVIALPAGLDMAMSMRLGTAGLTAGLCVDALLRSGLETNSGEVLVTGATGGVGIIAVAILAKLGFEVVASTGKPEAQAVLQGIGASSILNRNEISEASPKPMLRERWAAAVDSVSSGEGVCGCLRGKDRSVVGGLLPRNLAPRREPHVPHLGLGWLGGGDGRECRGQSDQAGAACWCALGFLHRACSPL